MALWACLRHLQPRLLEAEPQKDLTVQWLRVSAVGKPPPIVPAFPVMDFTPSSAVQCDRGAAASCPLCVFVVSWLLCVIVSPLKLQRCCCADIRHLCALRGSSLCDTWPAACQWQTENTTFQFSGFYILSWNDVIRENDLFTILFFCALKCKNSLMCWFECFLLRLVVGLFAVGTRCLSGFHNKTSSAHSTESPIHSLFIPMESVLKPNQTEGE